VVLQRENVCPTGGELQRDSSFDSQDSESLKLGGFHHQTFRVRIILGIPANPISLLFFQAAVTAHFAGKLNTACLTFESDEAAILSVTDIQVSIESCLSPSRGKPCISHSFDIANRRYNSRRSR